MSASRATGENLSSFKVANTSKGDVYYVPEFVTEQEEALLLQKIRDSPQPKWKNLAKRRLQVWGGEVAKPSNVLLPSPLPPFLINYPDILGRLRDTGIFSAAKFTAPNHIIVNEYQPGQGIMPHEDGPSYYPAVATISLGGHAVFNYYKYSDGQQEYRQDMQSENRPSMDTPESAARAIDPNPIISLLLEPRSLVITTGELYEKCLHGIDEIEVDRFVKHAGSDIESSPQGAEEQSIGLEAQTLGAKVSNFSLIRNVSIREVLLHGGMLPRATRLSLTCRVVEKVAPRGMAGVWSRHKGER